MSIRANLKPGMASKDVRTLQELLSQDKSLYPEGMLNGSFGPATQRAVERFQKKYGIVSSGTPNTTGFGALGPKTRAKLQEVFSAPVSAASQPAPATGTSAPAPLTRTLAPGTKGNEVTMLQQMLSQDKSIYPEANVSGYFGTGTTKAIQRFQEKYGIAAKGEAGYGTVGPKTRAKLNEVFGTTPITPAPATPTTAPAVQTQIQQLQKQVEELLKKMRTPQ